MGSVNADGARLLGLVHDEIAGLGLTDTALVAALEEQVAATVAEIFPPDRPATDGDLALTDDEAGRIALAVMTGAVAVTEHRTVPAPATGPLATDLTTGQLLRAALGTRPRG
jgi:hypothetical protein